MPATKFFAVGVLFILCATSISCQDEEDKPPLSIDPFRKTIEVGNDAVFQCIPLAPNNLTRIAWFFPDNVTEIGSESNSSRIYVDKDSQLHFRSAQENDTGIYLCKTIITNSLSTVPVVSSSTMHGNITVTQLPASNSTGGHATVSTEAASTATFTDQIETPESYNATVELKVYVMPTYFTEGMIILGINLGLLLVFLICLTQSLVSERKRMQAYYKK